MSSISSSNVSGAALSSPPRNSTNEGGVSVDGNRISWPDDGWYEVQSATSYNTMSEGGTSASVPNGTYNVINHTTGERFKNIEVPSSTSSSAGSTGTSIQSRESTNEGGVSVDGNLISWPDDGWYQVQSASDYATISEGGTSVTVPNGTYNVINLTTHERFENVTVGLSSRQGITNPDIDVIDISDPGGTGPSPGTIQNPANLHPGNLHSGFIGTMTDGQVFDTPLTVGSETAQAAADEYSGGDLDGEFAETPTAPAPVSEPVAQPASSTPFRGSSNTDGETNSRGSGNSTNNGTTSAGFGDRTSNPGGQGGV